MTVMEAVREYLAACPLLAGGKLNVDFLPAEAASYSIEAVPVDPVVKRYIDGSELRRCAFVLATRAYYGEQIRSQLDNLAFFEQFGDWLDAQDRAGQLPVLDAPCTASRLRVTSSGYAFAPDTDTARYQIQCQLEYYRQA